MGAASLGTVSFGAAFFGRGSEGAVEAGRSSLGSLSSLDSTGFATVLGALGLIIGTAGRAGIGIAGTTLCTTAVVAEGGAVDIGVDVVTEPASEGGCVVAGVGISDTEGGCVVTSVCTSGTSGCFSSSLEVGVDNRVGIGIGSGATTAAARTFLRRRRLLPGKGSPGAEYHGSFTGLSAM